MFDQVPEWTYREVPGFRGQIWAPDIARVDGRDHLYYSVSRFGSNQSCIGLAVSTSLNADDPGFGWEDRGIVIRSRPGHDDWNAIDPNLVVDANRERWLSFGSFWGGIQLVALDSATGMPYGEPIRPATIAVRPLIWADDGWPLPGEPLGPGAGAARQEPPRPIAGRWIHSVDFENPRGILLTPSGLFQSAAGAGTWTVDGRVLSLHWGSPPDPVRIEACFLDPEQAAFVGRDPDHRLVRVVRARPPP